MMNEKERYREVEKRERLVQTFLIISGFLVTFTSGEFQRLIVLVFSIYLITIILYYIFLSRTRIYSMIDILALLSSYCYSLLILTFLSLQVTNGGFSSRDFCLFIALTAIFTFSLLSPETSDRIVERFEKFSKKQEEKHPKLLKIISVIMVIIIMVLGMYFYLTML